MYRPLINQGKIIPNISDLLGINYFGTFPDIGAFENNNSQRTFEKEQPQKNIKVYPNPNSGTFIIYTNQLGSYTIFNAIGQPIKSGNVTEGKNTITLQQIVSGNYFIIINAGAEQIIEHISITEIQ